MESSKQTARQHQHFHVGWNQRQRASIQQQQQGEAKKNYHLNVKIYMNVNTCKNHKNHGEFVEMWDNNGCNGAGAVNCRNKMAKI